MISRNDDDADTLNAKNAITPDPAPIVNTPQSVNIIDVNTSASSQNNLSNIQAIAQANASVGLAQTDIDKEIVDEQITEVQSSHWMKEFWRPAMAWLYMAICFMDFIFFPLLSMFLPVIEHGFGINATYVQWNPITLTNGGLIHASFGAVIGISAYGRTREKLGFANPTSG